MELAWICAQQVAVLFLLIGAGALGVKMGWLKAEGRQMLSSLLVNLVVRALPSKYTEFDLSEGRMYTLGDSSVQLAQSLQQDVTIYYLCETGSEDAIITKLLDHYAAESSHIHWEQKDPTLYPTFAAQYGAENASTGSLIVTSGEDSVVLDAADLYEYDYSDYYIRARPRCR